jgi:hypothetical protein
MHFILALEIGIIFMLDKFPGNEAFENHVASSFCS